MSFDEIADQSCSCGPITIWHTEIHEDELVHGFLVGASGTFFDRLKCFQAVTTSVKLEGAELCQLTLDGDLIEATVGG